MSAHASLQPHPHVSWIRQLANFLGCLAIIPMCRALAVNTRYPATVDLLATILLAELCRFNNEGRRIAFREAQTQTQPPAKDNVDVEKRGLRLPAKQPGNTGCDTIAAIVGWREDPELWERCLESYKTARGCKFLLAGIDGIDEDDQEMVDVFNKVRDPTPVLHRMESNTSAVP